MAGRKVRYGKKSFEKREGRGEGEKLSYRKVSPPPRLCKTLKFVVNVNKTVKFITVFV